MWKQQICKDLEFPSFDIWTKGKIPVPKMEVVLKNVFLQKHYKPENI